MRVYCFFSGRNYPGVRGQTQIIVRTKIDHFSSIAGGYVGSLRSGDDPFFFKQARLADGVQLFFQYRLQRFVHGKIISPKLQIENRIGVRIIFLILAATLSLHTFPRAGRAFGTRHQPHTFTHSSAIPFRAQTKASIPSRSSLEVYQLFIRLPFANTAHGSCIAVPNVLNCCVYLGVSSNYKQRQRKI